MTSVTANSETKYTKCYIEQHQFTMFCVSWLGDPAAAR